jgi:undecaprenyl-diphosphatase
MRAPLLKVWHRMRRLERHELAWLGVGLAACMALFTFVALAGEVMDGDTHALDTRILIALRDPVDPSRPRGPAWLPFVLLDLTALGGSTVLGLVVVSIAGFLVLQTRYRTALIIVITAATGEALNAVLKNAFLRPRPTVVPYLRDVVETSFPSGHAMESAIIYLTLGAMLMRVAERPLTKAYCLTMAVLMTFLVGLSRVYLGVHYPTDVIGGWTFGFAWASVCWLIAQRYDRESGVAQERKKGQ